MARSKAEKKWRERYAKASYRLRQQYKKLVAKYPEAVALDRYGLGDFESLRDLGEGYSQDLIKKRTRMFEQMLKSGELSLQRHRRARAGAVQTLKEKGIPITQQNIGGFFKFMDDLRARGIAGMKSSREWARTFTQAQKKEMSRDELLENINRWTKGFEKSQKYTPRLRKTSSASMR